MKTVLIIILVLVLSIGAGYFVLPLLIQKETAVLKSEIQAVKQRLERIEKSMEIAPLQPDADFQKVIQTVKAGARSAQWRRSSPARKAPRIDSREASNIGLTQL